MPDRHKIDAVRRARCNLDKLTADAVACTPELMSLDRSNDIALNAAHTHTQCQQLHGKGLSGATGTEQVQIGIFIFLRVKQIDNAQ